MSRFFAAIAVVIALLGLPAIAAAQCGPGGCTVQSWSGSYYTPSYAAPVYSSPVYSYSTSDVVSEVTTYYSAPTYVYQSYAVPRYSTYASGCTCPNCRCRSSGFGVMFGVGF